MSIPLHTLHNQHYLCQVSGPFFVACVVDLALCCAHNFAFPGTKSCEFLDLEPRKINWVNGIFFFKLMSRLTSNIPFSQTLDN